METVRETARRQLHEKSVEWLLALPAECLFPELREWLGQRIERTNESIIASAELTSAGARTQEEQRQVEHEAVERFRRETCQFLADPSRQACRRKLPLCLAQ